MKIGLIIERYADDVDGTIGEETKNFCSKECAKDYLFETFEVEGIEISDSDTINLTNCMITVCETEDDLICAYGCD